MKNLKNHEEFVNESKKKKSANDVLHLGGGCFLGGGDMPCDDSWEDSEGNVLMISCSKDAHFDTDNIKTKSDLQNHLQKWGKEISVEQNDMDLVEYKYDENGKLELTMHMLETLPERQHVVTAEENKKLYAYFEEQDGEDFEPFDLTGKTLEAGSKIIGPPEFEEETLQHMVCVLFGDKYEGVY
jgi:hypothetical protein